MRLTEPVAPLLMWLLLVGVGAIPAQAQIQESDFGRSDRATLYDFSIHWTPGSSTETHQADDLLRFLEGFSRLPTISSDTTTVGAELELVESSEDSLLFALPMGASPSFEVGDLIIGDPANPYFRRVRDIVPQVGALLIETGTASLAVAVTQGYLKADLVLGASDTTSAKNDGAGLIWEGIHTIQRDFLNAEVSGSLRLDPQIAVEMAFDEGLDFFRMETTGGMDYDLAFELSSMDLLKIGEVDRRPIEWEVAKWEEVFIQTIGPIPVWERVVVRVTAAIEFEGDARGEVRLPFVGESAIRLGAEFDRNLPSDRRWRILGEAGGGPAGEHPILTLEGELIGRFHLRPEITVRFYDEPGPMLSLRETVEFEGFGAPPPHVYCEWAATSQTERILDFDLRLLDSLVETWQSTSTTQPTALGNGSCQAPASEVPELVEVDAGTFTMGRRDDGDDRLVGSADETPRRPVTLSAYRIGKNEVANRQFVGVLNWALDEGLLDNAMGEPYMGGDVYAHGRVLLSIVEQGGFIHFSEGRFLVGENEGVNMENHPAARVSWYGAVAYCNWLSQIEDLPPCYTLTAEEWTLSNRFGGGFRLPTEAEWERAAAWDESKHWTYGFESDALTGRDRCNYWDGSDFVNPMGFTSPPYTAPVGWFNGVNVSPNGGIQTLISRSPVGCFDMSGNVMEWCEDHYLSTYYSTPGSREENPLSLVSPTGTRVVRGGSWTNTASASRTANRESSTPVTSTESIGFRIAQSVDKTSGGPPTAAIPAGAFTMGNTGSPRDAVCGCVGCECELPSRTVQIDYPLLVGRYEITNEEYALVLNWAKDAGRLEAADGSPYAAGDVHLNGRFLIDVTSAYADVVHEGGVFVSRVRSGVSMAMHPVKRVSWYGAAAFCNWLSELEGLPPAYNLDDWRLINRPARGFRLPSEAEWEFACRGSVTNPNRYLPFSFGDDAPLDLSTCDPSDILNAHMVWCGNSNQWTEAVGIRMPNDLGLHDVHGNVREWCEDEWHGDYSGEGRPDDGRAWTSHSGGAKTIRGGGWIDLPANCRSASRMAAPPELRSSAIGFRVVRLR